MGNNLREDQIEDIQSKIDYVFKNKALLNQAFTRKSYSAEHAGTLDNELLEHIGDSFLGNIVTGILVKSFTSVGPNGLESKKNEKDFTDMKKYLVCSERLSEKIDDLDLSKHLITGKGDKNLNIDDKERVKEDLFEAIIAAVTIDSNFDMIILEKVVQRMMNLDYYIQTDFKDMKENYTGKLKEYFEKKKLGLPIYQESNDSSDNSIFIAKMDFNGQAFEGRATNKKVAKQEVSRKIIEYIKENSLHISVIDLVGELSLGIAINQLKELNDKGHIKNAVYSEEYLFIEGIHNWKVTCSVEGFDKVFVGVHNKKTEAKKIASLKMLEYLSTISFDI